MQHKRGARPKTKKDLVEHIQKLETKMHQQWLDIINLRLCADNWFENLRDLMAMPAGGRDVFASSDLVGQEELFQIQHKLAKMTLNAAQRVNRQRELVKQFRWIYEFESEDESKKDA